MTGPLTVYRGTETLRRGWTTGSCAAAASQAAAILLLTGSAPAEMRLLTPGGVTFNLPVEQASLHDGEAVCAVRKDAGDDPDITNGVLISSAVRRADSGIVIDGGSGVGRVTRPGLAEPVGEAAINPGPRAQIKSRNCFRICCQLSAGCSRYHPFTACFEISPSHQYCSRRKRSRSRSGTSPGTYRTSYLH